MTTEVIAPLPIPEQTVIGQGSYTIPANKYALLTGNTAVGGACTSYNPSFGSAPVSVSGSANTVQNWLNAGDTISTDLALPNVTVTMPQDSNNSQTGRSNVLVNGIVFCSTYVNSVTGQGNGSGTHRHVYDGAVSWTAAIFPIPKNNLPDALKEGN